MKRILAFVLAVAMSFAMVACGGNNATNTDTSAGNTAAGNTATDSGSDDTIKIGYMSSAAVSGFWKEVADSIKKACEENGIELLFSETNAEPDKMRLAFDTFVAAECDFIIDGNSLADLAAPFAAEAKELGIPMLVLETNVEDAYFYGLSNQTCGEAIGDYLVDVVGKEWNGEIDLVIINAPWTIAAELCNRSTAAYDKLNAAFDLEGVPVVKTDLTSDPTIAYQTCMDALTAHPDADNIVYISFTDDTLLNALGAMDATGRSENIIGTGCDCVAGVATILKDIHDNGGYSPVRASAYLDTPGYGGRVLEIVNGVLNGEDVPRENPCPVFLVDANNIYDFFE